MAYFNESSQAIYLYTPPLQGDFINGYFQLGIFSHWAVCIRERCYEVTKDDKSEFVYKPTPEQEWRAKRQYDSTKRPARLGYMAKPHSDNIVHTVGT
jgi:hypothetical protein